MSDPSPAFEITAENFQVEVVEASKSLPVIVDFWAPWCGPCRQLGPLLDKLASEFAGEIRIVKVNTEASPDLASGFGVSSIPYVVAVRDGQIVDEFVGLLPEPELRRWIEKLLPSPAEVLFKQGRELEEQDPAAATESYRNALTIEPGADRIKIALARALLAVERDAEAASLIEELATRGFLEPEAEQLKSQLELRAAAADTGGIDQARKAAAADPSNLSLQIRLADALAVGRQHQEALDLLLDVIRKDRTGYGDEARATMVKIFDLLGPQHELVSEYRRKLATALY
ncbi:MAG: thioredoxin [Planctomycetota bacterium]|nr:thioredoxin [Planctomycetaceae bacterium]MDQ3329059.1 thioredoxin [Planctomycetota bacterium]